MASSLLSSNVKKEKLHCGGGEVQIKSAPQRAQRNDAEKEFVVRLDFAFFRGPFVAFVVALVLVAALLRCGLCG